MRRPASIVLTILAMAATARAQEIFEAIRAGDLNRVRVLAEITPSVVQQL